ncbi:VOC family protein [Candidatus Pseudoscillospira sp. SGI.172]|uniref:VOC family protein n=1 Tax=Candidatus Pseudoscillospira sp. SGI.172 TaxID=3420582 RepID=UPI0009BAA422|nr:VOC family protein [Pseudoflavonifractor sp.]MDY3020213.1 VOC family protein [Oscillospiraceae bacterium]
MFRFNHVNFNVLDLEKSLAFYKKALGLTVVREKAGENDLGPFRLVYLGDDAGSFTLELTWLAARKEPYDLGEGEFHLAFTVSDLAEAHARHEAMGCICFENKAMGIYFIEDPDGYWIEIVPEKK